MSDRNDTIYRGWKQIAQRLGVSVRTAQRREHDAGLPVRRHLVLEQNGMVMAVYAEESELRHWLRGKKAPRAP